MKFGVFMAPLHHTYGENPTLSLEQDLELIEHLDRLGFDEAWVGEHHSGATEIYASPEILMAAAAQRTRHIRLGSGVIDLPFHHPFHVADRMVMLDHLTRGRVMFGVGSGARHADFWMLGYDPADKHRMMAQSLEAIMGLLRGEEPVTMQTDWFTLKEARLQLASYTQPHVTLAVAGSGSQDGTTSAAGRYGLWQLSAGPLPALRAAWSGVEATAQQYGTLVSRENWRIAKFVHLAETREEAMNDCRATMRTWYGLKLVGLAEDSDPETRPEQAAAGGGAIIGTPDDMIQHLEQLAEDTGGFGGFLAGVYGLASREKAMKSFELWAKWVAPRFQSQYRTMKANWDWVVATHGGPAGQAY